MKKKTTKKKAVAKKKATGKPAPKAKEVAPSMKDMIKSSKDTWEVMADVITLGDLAKLTPQQRVNHYKSVCESLGLNPLTKPFDYISLNGKLTFYATKNCTDQIRGRNRISITVLDRQVTDGMIMVKARAQLPDGRQDESIAVVPMTGYNGASMSKVELANAWMKCETKAKRRVTLSIMGLGFSDETEVHDIPDAKFVNVDTKSGDIDTKPKNTETLPDSTDENLVDDYGPALKKMSKELKDLYHAIKEHGKWKDRNLIVRKLIELNFEEGPCIEFFKKELDSLTNLGGKI